VPDPELEMFTSTTKFTWQEVANSDELGQFLTEAGVNSAKQRRKLERLLYRDGFDTIADLHGMSSANLQVYLNKGVPHMNVLKLVEYIHEVWEAHGQEKIADLVPPATPNEVADEPTNDRGSIITLKERQEATRPTPMRFNSSALQREAMKTELEKGLASEGLSDLTDPLWAMGIRKARQLADIEWEDVSAEDEGISRIHFRVLQRIGREHSAPNVPPSTGDVEMQELAQLQPQARL